MLSGIIETALELASRISVFKGLQVHRANFTADRLIAQNRFEEARNELEQAIALLKNSPSAKKPDPDLLGMLLGRLGMVLDELHCLSEAEKVYEESLEAFDKSTKKDSEKWQVFVAMTLSNYANTLTDLENYEQAGINYEKSLKIRRKLATLYSEYFNPKVATTLISYGRMLRLYGKFEQSREKYEDAISILHSESGATDSEMLGLTSQAYIGLSLVARDVSDLSAAKTTCEEAVRIRRLIGDGPGLAEALHNLSVIKEQLDHVDEAIDDVTESIQIVEGFERLRPGAYWPDLAKSLNNRANYLARAKRYQPAMADYQRAIGIRRELADSIPAAFLQSLASSLINYAVTEKEFGNLQAAQVVLEEALHILEPNENNTEDPVSPELARVLYNLGTVHCEQSHFEDGRAMFARAAKIQEELRLVNPHLYESKLAKTLCSLGTVLHMLGDNESSCLVFVRAIAVCRSLANSDLQEDIAQLSIALSNYGNTLSGLKELDTAIEAYTEAVVNERELVSRQAEEHANDLASNLHNVGAAYADRNDSDDDIREALAALLEAETIRARLAVQENLKSVAELATTRSELGKLYVQCGRAAEGLELIRLAAESLDDIAMREPDSWVEHRLGTYAFLGNVLLSHYLDFRDESELTAAHSWLSKAATIAETLRYRFVDPLQRRRHSEKVLQGVLDGLVSCCVEMWFLDQGKTEKLEDAIQYSEQGRMRALLDALKVDLTPHNTPTEVIQRLKSTLGELSHYGQLLYETEAKAGQNLPPIIPVGSGGALDSGGLNFGVISSGLKAKYYATRDNYQRILQEIREKYDPYFDPEGESGVACIDEIRRALPDRNTAAVQFTITEIGCYAIIIYPDNISALKISDLNLESSRLVAQKWIAGLQKHRNGGTFSEWQATSEDLLNLISEIVIYPMSTNLRPDVERLVLVPHRELHIFPLAGCKINDSELLVDKCELWTSPSMSILCDCAKRRFGDCDQVLYFEIPSHSLDFQAIEKKRLEQCYPEAVRCLNAEEHCGEDFWSIASTANVLHYTGHGKFNPDDPMSSLVGERGDMREFTLMDFFCTPEVAACAACGFKRL